MADLIKYTIWGTQGEYRSRTEEVESGKPRLDFTDDTPRGYGVILDMVGSGARNAKRVELNLDRAEMTTQQRRVLEVFSIPI